MVGDSYFWSHYHSRSFSNTLDSFDVACIFRRVRCNCHGYFCACKHTKLSILSRFICNNKIVLQFMTTITSVIQWCKPKSFLTLNFLCFVEIHRKRIKYLHFANVTNLLTYTYEFQKYSFREYFTNKSEYEILFCSWKSTLLFVLNIYLNVYPVTCNVLCCIFTKHYHNNVVLKVRPHKTQL